jgi:hypothetical protein
LETEKIRTRISRYISDRFDIVSKKLKLDVVWKIAIDIEKYLSLEEQFLLLDIFTTGTLTILTLNKFLFGFKRFF